MNSVHIEHADPVSPQIFIPLSDRGRPSASFAMSSRLANVLHSYGVVILGDLHGRSIADLAAVRNCGRHTISELVDFVQKVQQGNAPLAQVLTEHPPIRVPTQAWEVELAKLPLSVRLGRVLSARGLRTLGDLAGLDPDTLKDDRSCGRKTLAELKALLRRASEGEFSPGDSVATWPNLLRAVTLGLEGVSSRNLEILLLRLGARGQEPSTLEEVGQHFKLTRERVRQVVKKVVNQIRLSGGAQFDKTIGTLQSQEEDHVLPLTPELLKLRLGNDSSFDDLGILFYLRLLAELDERVDPWIDGQVGRGPRDPRADKWLSDIRILLGRQTSRLSSQEVLRSLRSEFSHRRLSPRDLLSALRSTRSVVLDCRDPLRPELHLARLRIADCSRAVLTQSPDLLTPEELIAQARARFGEEAIPWTPRTVENALVLIPDVFRLGPRAFGMRRHLRIAQEQWLEIGNDFERLLTTVGRPISTLEVVDSNQLPRAEKANGYELTEIFRHDCRFTDLGRHLFGLESWGVREREHIKDLIPQVLAEAGRPLETKEIVQRIKSRRSFSATSLAAALQSHPEVHRIGFGFWTLDRDRESIPSFLAGSRTAVERAIRLGELPVSFAGLCDAMGLDSEGELAGVLWDTVVALRDVKKAPPYRSQSTLLLHERTPLERVLVAAAKSLARPAKSYEIHWEAVARFGGLFDGSSEKDFADRLNKSERFIRNAQGEYILDEQATLDGFDKELLGNAALDHLLNSGEALGCDDLLERLEVAGFDSDELSPDILASILKTVPNVVEVGHNRFRATR